MDEVSGPGMQQQAARTMPGDTLAGSVLVPVLPLLACVLPADSEGCRCTPVGRSPAGTLQFEPSYSPVHCPGTVPWCSVPSRNALARTRVRHVCASCAWEGRPALL